MCLDPDDDWELLFGFVYDSEQSLGFVVDTTGSMREEIAAAKDVITNMIASEENIDVLAYILTPYNDWDDPTYDTDLPSMSQSYDYLPLKFWHNVCLFSLQMLDLLLLPLQMWLEICRILCPALLT